MMLMRGSFRIRDRESGEWVVGYDGGAYLTTPHRTNGLVFEPHEREEWEGDKEFEIVEVTETEIMAAMGPKIAPRLPGFE